MTSKGKYDSPFRAVLKGISDLYGKKNDGVKLPAEIDLKGKNVLITGASSGLGYAVAQRIAAAGAKVFMADCEDSMTPTWFNVVQGQINLRDAVNRSIEFTNEAGKHYALGDDPAVLPASAR